MKMRSHNMSEGKSIVECIEYELRCALAKYYAKVPLENSYGRNGSEGADILVVVNRYDRNEWGVSYLI